MTALEPPPPAHRADGSGRTRHTPGQRWPACGCRLCLDAFICPPAVTRAGRALVVVAALAATCTAVVTAVGAL